MTSKNLVFFRGGAGESSDRHFPVVTHVQEGRLERCVGRHPRNVQEDKFRSLARTTAGLPSILGHPLRGQDAGGRGDQHPADVSREAAVGA